MIFDLSFGKINIINNNIAEVLVDEGVIFTLEMCEEYDAFLLERFPEKFAILNNKIHKFSYTYEANLHIASLENLIAVAVVTYDKNSYLQSQNYKKLRLQDHWLLKEFSGFKMGREQALEWLEAVLADSMIKR